MFVSGLTLLHFRSYCDESVTFGPGLNVVVGANATGKTNLLEGAFFALRGTSPRTRREEKMITWGERFARVSARLDGLGDGPQEVEIGYAPGQSKRVRWDGLEVTSLDDLRRRCQVFIFVPESLLLVKGSPARRRAHVDGYAAAIDASYAAAARELQAALRHRNAQLVNVRAGADPSTLDPWDAQFAHASVELGRRRVGLLAELAPHFAEAAEALAPGGQRFALQLVGQLAALEYDEAAMVKRLRERRAVEVQRGMSLFGPQRDDLRFLEIDRGPSPVDGELRGADEPAACSREKGPPAPADSCGSVTLPAEGRDLRLFGSQGEQRAAVLALLLAEQALARERTDEVGPLFLDDVMSELDDARRRLLVARLRDAGQTIVTTTDRHYFTDEELEAATVIELSPDASLHGRGA